MIICHDIPSWKAFAHQHQTQAIGFVPTMGHLHEGHISLIKASQALYPLTVVSIFVNPTQFNDPKDYHSYPKTLEDDLKKLSAANVHAVFCPTELMLYPDQYTYRIHETLISQMLEGAHRPGHFEGVLTVIMKLLNIIRPEGLFLGEKDYQQYVLIKGMVDAFYMNIQVHPCPTIREISGLAKSSRNSRLTAEEKSKASLLAKYLKSDLSITDIFIQLNQAGFRVEYVQEHEGRRFIAAWLGHVRLIDNISLAEINKTQPSN